MMSTLAHEIAETLSDPGANVPHRAWEFANGQENGDTCTDKFGHIQEAPGGGKYNIYIEPYYYYIQDIWSAKTQKCEGCGSKCFKDDS